MVVDGLQATTWPSDIVRDSVNMHLIHGGPADVVQFIHLALARQRRLHHMDRLLGDAIAEALNWIQIPLSAEAMNADTYDLRVWEVIAREAEFGSGPTSTVPSQVTTAPSVLLQPDLPASLEELTTLPGVEEHVVMYGYRRRAWRQTTGRLFREAGRHLPVGSWVPEDDRDVVLHLQSSVQALHARLPATTHPSRRLLTSCRRKAGTIKMYGLFTMKHSSISERQKPKPCASQSVLLRCGTKCGRTSSAGSVRACHCSLRDSQNPPAASWKSLRCQTSKALPR